MKNNKNSNHRASKAKANNNNHQIQYPNQYRNQYQTLPFLLILKAQRQKYKNSIKNKRQITKQLNRMESNK